MSSYCIVRQDELSKQLTVAEGTLKNEYPDADEKIKEINLRGCDELKRKM